MYNLKGPWKEQAQKLFPFVWFHHCLMELYVEQFCKDKSLVAVFKLVGFFSTSGNYFLINFWGRKKNQFFSAILFLLFPIIQFTGIQF